MRLLICFIVAIAAINGNAQIITDRPDQTESPISVPSGSLQIESGIQMSFSGSDFKREILVPTNLFRIGLSKSVELRVVSEYSIQGSETNLKAGIPDIQLGAKVWLAGGEDATTNIGWLTHITLPTGNDNFTTDDYRISTLISIDHSLSDVFRIGYNLGYSNMDYFDGSFTYTAAFGYGINDKMSIYFEPYGQYSSEADLELNINAGLAYLIKPNIQFDFSFGNGLTDRMNYLSTGMSWLFK